jgi:hypothetical protein
MTKAKHIQVDIVVVVSDNDRNEVMASHQQDDFVLVFPDRRSRCSMLDSANANANSKPLLMPRFSKQQQQHYALEDLTLPSF